MKRFRPPADNGRMEASWIEATRAGAIFALTAIAVSSGIAVLAILTVVDVVAALASPAR